MFVTGPVIKSDGKIFDWIFLKLLKMKYDTYKSKHIPAVAVKTRLHHARMSVYLVNRCE
jgi:hypothetical protein